MISPPVVPFRGLADAIRTKVCKRWVHNPQTSLSNLIYPGKLVYLDGGPEHCPMLLGSSRECLAASSCFSSSDEELEIVKGQSQDQEHGADCTIRSV